MRLALPTALPLLLSVFVFALGGAVVSAQDSPASEPLGHVRTQNEANDFHAPRTRSEWRKRRAFVRDRLLVSTGIYPWPSRESRGPLNAQVYGKFERDGYTVEKVVIQTLPGYYLSGNLYRPTTGKAPYPGILNPHGHWAAGRSQLEVQARCAGLARQGAIAFAWDMLGYFDAKPFPHSFDGADLRAWGISMNGLQLWNSIRCLDFLLSLPEVDQKRIACTGASGGGTQTFELCAVDDRVHVAAPAVMVSDYFQGGCQGENAPLKRIDTENIEFAACFAPKPQFLVGATGDWTKNTETKVLPALREVYALYGSAERINGVVHDFGHNYNQTSRESVYNFLETALFRRKPTAPVSEAPFTPEDRATISTWDADHPRPADFVTPEQLKPRLKAWAQEQLRSWAPQDRRQWEATEKTLTTALTHVLGLPQALTVPVRKNAHALSDADALTHELEYAAAEGLRPVPLRLHLPNTGRVSTITVVAHPRGRDGVAKATVEALRQAGHAVLTFDAFATGAGEAALAGKRSKTNHYATYNRTTLAERVLDTLTAVRYAQGLEGVRKVQLLGVGRAGSWALLARPFAGSLHRVAIDARGYDWPDAGLPADAPMYQPGALRYGGMRAYAALGRPSRLLLHNAGEFDTSWLMAAYALRDRPGRLTIDARPANPGQVLAFLTE